MNVIESDGLFHEQARKKDATDYRDTHVEVFILATYIFIIVS